MITITILGRGKIFLFTYNEWNFLTNNLPLGYVRVFDLGIEYGPKLLERFECNPVKVHVVQIPRKDLR